MKTSTVILAGTLALNLALVAVLSSRSPTENDAPAAAAGVQASGPSAASGGTGQIPGASASVPGDGTNAGSTASAASREATPEAIAAMFRGTPHEVVARLRASGYSNDLVASVAYALIEQMFDTRIRALSGYGQVAPFWSNEGTTMALTRSPEFRAINQEMNKMAQEVLGPGYFGDEISRRQQFGNLPVEKVEAIMAAQREYSEKYSELFGMMGAMLPEDREKQAQLMREQREAIVRALTPEELNEYDLRRSSTAMNLRNTLMGFDPNEEEFLAIYRLRQPFDEKWNNLPAMTTELSQQRQADQQKLDDEIAAALGPGRAEDYKLLSNSNYRYVSVLVDKLKLPPQAGKDAMAVQQDIQQRLTQARQLPPANRTAALQQLSDEAHERLTAILGERGITAYKTTSILGSWINNIVPQPPVAPPPAAR